MVGLSGGFTLTVTADMLSGNVTQVAGMVILPIYGGGQVQIDLGTALCVEAALKEARAKKDAENGVLQLKYLPVTVKESD